MEPTDDMNEQKFNREIQTNVRKPSTSASEIDILKNTLIKLEKSLKKPVKNEILRVTRDPVQKIQKTLDFENLDQKKIPIYEKEPEDHHTLIQKISEAAESIEDNRYKITQAAESIEEHKIAISEAQKLKEEFGSILAQSVKVIEEMKNGRELCNDALDKIQGIISQTTKSIDEQKTSISQTQKLKEELKTTFTQTSKAVEEMKTTFSQTSKSIEEMKTALSQTVKTKEEITKASDNLNKLLKEAQEISSNISSISKEKAVLKKTEPETRTTVSESFEVPETSELDAELDDILELLVSHTGSDLHLKVGSAPIVRIEGELIPVGSQPLTSKDTRRLILRIMTQEMIKELFNRRELDFSHEAKCGRFRVNVFLQKGSVSASMRLVKSQIPSFKKLYLPPALERVAGFHNGLFLVTGPAGTGKSTTLAALINFMNETRKLHVITIEDPIEYMFSDKQSIITQRELGIDTESFETALKMALRQDPDVIMIGELRDSETVAQALLAAETGQLVLSTLHTPNTIQAIRRLFDFFPSGGQKQFQNSLASSLRGIISQRLIKRIDREGRIPSIELLFNTATISSLIREGNIHEIYQYVREGGTEGMITFTESLSRLYKAGFISKEDAMYHAEQPTELRLTLAQSDSAQRETQSSEKQSQWWQ